MFYSGMGDSLQKTSNYATDRATALKNVDLDNALVGPGLKFEIVSQAYRTVNGIPNNSSPLYATVRAKYNQDGSAKDGTKSLTTEERVAVLRNYVVPPEVAAELAEKSNTTKYLLALGAAAAAYFAFK